eukprot:m.975716 g.975716  ORF g.975716 m.975716 type:complete len:861 (+) comp23942_c1_seq8:368-2950(+)
MSGQASWEQLDNRFYRKVEVYEMDWIHKDGGEGIGLEQYNIAVGHMGGSIALARDPKVAFKARAGPSRPCIDIYSASGFKKTTIKWDKARIIALGWTDEEGLAVVTEDANVHIYNVYEGVFEKQFTMGQIAAQAGIREAKFCPDGHGLVVLTNDDRFFSVGNFNDPKPKRFAAVEDPLQSADQAQDAASMPGGSAISSWAIHMNERTIEVIVSAYRNIFVLDPNESWNPVLDASQLGVYSAMSVSPSGRLIALFGETGKIWVLSTDFQENHTAFDTKSHVAPRQLVWCGSDSVVAYWDQLGTGTGTLLMVGPRSKYISYNYERRVHLMPEIDGLRIIGETHHEFLQAVPDSVEKIFQLGFSKYPGAMLYMARQAFEQKDPMADDLIRKVKDDSDYPDGLFVAIEQCIEAAGQEWDSSTQRSLLRAARFGMDFVTCPSENFVDMCQTLRVLHHIRDYHVGMPLTYRQFKMLSIEVIIDRLIARDVFWLAFEICKYLKLTGSKSTNRVLEHWACRLVSADASDDKIARKIIEKLAEESVEGVSYAKIARAASMQGRPDLAIRLLECEPKYSEQVPLLLSMNEEDMALEKAIQSGDTGLAQFVLLDVYHKKSSKGDFLSSINTKPAARDLFLQYCRENEPSLLKDFYYSHDVLHETANLTLVDAYHEEQLETRIQLLRKAASHYTNAREYGFHAKVTEEQTKLLMAQRALEDALKQPFVNLPLGDTLYQVILQGDLDRANRLKKDFKVPDKRFWWIKVKALAHSSNFSELERFSKSKKSPIGYEPFVEECILKNNRYEAKKYIDKCPVDTKVNYFVRIASFEDAVQVAIQLKSEEAFQFIEGSCKGRRDVLKMIADARGGGGR